jgi:NNP family nitrate/nitrite transporter-like MFS transporter
MKQPRVMQHVVGAVRSGHWPSLLGAWVHFEISFMAWLLIGALGVSIAEEFGLSATQKGLLVAVPLLGGALLRVPVGVSSDRWGSKRTGLIVLLSEALALSWGWLAATSYSDMLAVGLLLGTAGASFAVALPLASRAYPLAHQGLAMGVAASANSGTFLAAFFAPRLAQLVGWHNVFGLMLVPLTVTMILFAVLVPSDVEASRARESRTGREAGRVRASRELRWWPLIGELLRERSIHRLCLLYAVTFGGFVGFCSFLPIFAHDQYGLDLVRAGSITALCGLAGSLARPFGGYLADRFGGAKVLSWVFLGIAVCILAVASLPGLTSAIILLVTGVGAMGFGNGVVFRMVSDRFHKQIGTASGIIGAAGGLGGFLLPACLGFFKDLSGTYQTGLVAFGAVSVVACLNTVLDARAQAAADGK